LCTAAAVVNLLDNLWSGVLGACMAKLMKEAALVDGVA
jgi:hypothetical protein